MMSTCQDAHPRLQQLRDEELVVLARTGHDRAVESLLTRYRYLVERKARTYFLAGADHEDVVQEGMIGLYKAIRDYRDDRLARFRAFAEICVTRQIISAVKTATRQKHSALNGYLSLHQPLIESDGDGSLLERLPDDRIIDPAQSLIETREKRIFQNRIEQALSDLESSVLGFYLQGKSYREMSNELVCGTKCVDNALQRVKRKIGLLLSTPIPEA